jgi:hypothetical protein
MSRTISAAAKAAAFAQQTDQVYLALLVIEHDDLSAPIRVVNNAADVVSGGETYTAFPFDITLPSDADDSIPHATLTISNVDRTVTEAIRTISGAPTVTISVVLAASPDTIEVGPYEMTLRNVSWDANTVSGALASEDVLNEPFPGEFMVPDTFPGLF